jgi:hypothetical protein
MARCGLERPLRLEACPRCGTRSHALQLPERPRPELVDPDHRHDHDHDGDHRHGDHRR